MSSSSPSPPKLLRKSYDADEFMSKSDVLTVLILTVMDLAVVVLLNISSLEKKFFLPSSLFLKVFSSTFLVSHLLAYLSMIMMAIMNSTMIAISNKKRTD